MGLAVDSGCVMPWIPVVSGRGFWLCYAVDSGCVVVDSGRRFWL